MAGNELVLIGTKGGPSIIKGWPNPTSSCMTIGGKLYVIDCGLGVTRGIVEADFQLKDLDTIFITHLHSDHVVEFGSLIHSAWCSGRGGLMNCYGPKGSQDLLDGMFQSFGYDIEIRVEDEGLKPLQQLVGMTEFTEGPVFEDDIVKVSALRNIHPPIEESYALRFEFDGGSVVFSGDTAYFPPLAEFAEGADILIHEVMHAEGLDRICEKLKDTKPNLRKHLLASHTLAADVGRIAADANVGHLVLNHFVPTGDPEFGPEAFAEEVRKNWSGELTVGYDGVRLQF